MLAKGQSTISNTSVAKHDPTTNPMFDTVALSQPTYSPPKNIPAAARRRSSIRKNSAGNVYQVIVSPESGSAQPHIVIKRGYGNVWRTRVEVSIGRQLFGSNLYLPTSSDIPRFLQNVSDYVTEQTGQPFVAQQATVVRLDVTKHYNVDPNMVLDIIDQYRHCRLPRYNTILINGETVNFDVKGKKLSKRIIIYSKFHELSSVNAPSELLELAKGVLRVEVQHKVNQSVAYLQESLDLPDHKATTILTDRVYNSVIEKMELQLNISEAILPTGPDIDRLYLTLGPTKAANVVSHLALTKIKGRGYFNDALYGVSARAARERYKMAAKGGVSSL